MREKSEMNLREAAQYALEAMEDHAEQYPHMQKGYTLDAIAALRAALEEPVQTEKDTAMPITDDHGKALLPQYRVIEQHGNWRLLYAQIQSGEAVRHEFRIQKLRHDVALYPGISLVKAQKRFHEHVEADNE